MFITSFGQYVPCDLSFYKKIKRIRNLIGQVDAWANRWERSRRKLPKNRYFTWNKKYLVEDSWVMTSLWNIQGNCIYQTDLGKRYWESYDGARHPKMTAEEVKPITINEEELNNLLCEIEVFLNKMPR